MFSHEKIRTISGDEFDKILNSVEQAFLLVAAEKHLHHTSIERYREGEQNITLTWPSSDQINRNINTLITEPESEGTSRTLEVKVHAWQDEDLEDQGKRVRHWQHEEVASLSIPLEETQLKLAVNECYSRVSSWSQQDLEKQTQLTLRKSC